MPSGFSMNVALEQLTEKALGIWSIDSCGVTPSEPSVPVLLHKDAYSHFHNVRVLLVSGFTGRVEDVELTLNLLDSYVKEYLQSNLLISAVPCVKMDQLSAGDEFAGDTDTYPPIDKYYDHQTDPESRYLWRWTSFMSPDLIIELVKGPYLSYEVNEAADYLSNYFDATLIGTDGSFIKEIGSAQPNGLGPIPGMKVTMPLEHVDQELAKIHGILSNTERISSSASQRILDTRSSRTPVEVAKLLASRYGNSLDPVVYTQGVAISGRLRLMSLTDDHTELDDIVNLVDPLKDLGKIFDDGTGTPNLAGLLWGDELSDLTGNKRYSDLIVQVANMYEYQGSGIPPKPSDPDYRTEDMFMNAAMLGRAFYISGDSYYLEMLIEFLLQSDVQQSSGLFWHSRTTPYYWGRGNGFAAMGFAEALTYIPRNNPAFDDLLQIHLKHLKALETVQRPSGMFSQVLDFPGSYEELTATCMIGYSIARGIRLGWLDRSFTTILQKCWKASLKRIEDDGAIVDGCTGTGVQTTTKEYLDRPAIHGFDDRSGSMAIWFATEMERLSISQR